MKEQFELGNFVTCQTGRNFSSIPYDQAHEQKNKVVKGSGGVIGITENPQYLQKWLAGAPERSRVIKEFENHYLEEVILGLKDT